MGGIKGPKNAAQALNLEGLRKRMHTELQQAAEEIGIEGQDLGRHIIATSPTEGDWSKFYAGNPRRKGSVRAKTGRVDSGNMWESFTYAADVQGMGGNIEVGWVEGDPDGYFEDQEYGFTNEYPGGRFAVVEGMDGLNQGEEQMKPIARGVIDLAMKEALS